MAMSDVVPPMSTIRLGAGGRRRRARQDRLDGANAGELFGHERAVAAHDRHGYVQAALGEHGIDGVEELLDNRHESRVQQCRGTAPDDVGLGSNRRGLDDELAERVAQELGAALLDDGAIVQRVQAGDTERVGLLEERRPLPVQLFPIGNDHVVAIVRTLEIDRQHVGIGNAELALRINPMQHLVGRAHDDELRAAALPLDACVRRQRRGKRRLLGAHKHVARQAVEYFSDAACQVALGGERLHVREHAHVIRVDDHRVGERAARINSQSYHASAFQLT